MLYIKFAKTSTGYAIATAMSTDKPSRKAIQRHIETIKLTAKFTPLFK